MVLKQKANLDSLAGSILESKHEEHGVVWQRRVY